MRTTPWRAAPATPCPSADKKKALETALQQIEKNFGKGAVMRLGDKPDMNVDSIPTGSLALDAALGIGGVPKGRIIEIYGPESSGKTTLALHIVAQAQKRGGEVAFVDAEHALDPTYARKLGVDIDSMLVSQPDTGEQALEITDALVRSGAIDVVVVDSVAALTPRAEIEGEMGDTFVGLQARLMSRRCASSPATISRSNCVVIFINQLRMKIGVMYGNPETTTGGNALKFYASVRIDIRRIEAIKNGSEIIGNRTRAKIVKNKVAPPFKEAISTSCTARASRAGARSSISACSSSSSRRAAAGSPSTTSASARAATTPSSIWSSIPTSPTGFSWEEIRAALRDYLENDTNE
jgi:recombination protein RecA